MATFYLMNNIRVGTLVMSAGSLIDDTVTNTAPILAAGGTLMPTATAGLATAATLAETAKLRGQPPEVLESIMNAALDKEQQDQGNTATGFETDLGSTAAGKGASKVAVQNAGLTLGSAQVEGALADVSLRATVHTVDGFIDAPIADLTAFVGVTGGTAQDDAKFKAGARLWVNAQADKTKLGIYVVGAVVGGVAPLTRAPDWAVGQLIKDGTVVRVAGNNITGTPHSKQDNLQDTFNDTEWTLLGDVVVGTDAIDGISAIFLNLEDTTISQKTLFAHMVHTTNVADLTAFPVAANNDGQTAIESNVVILGAQTTKAQNGPYIVGPVAGGNAPLKRPAWYQTGRFMPRGFVIRVMQGGKFAQTDWALFGDAGIAGLPGITVDTDDPKFRPLRVLVRQALAAGTLTITGIPIHSTSTSVNPSRAIAVGSTLTVGGYHPTTGGLEGITPGDIGTGQIIIEACVGAGTISNADTSTLRIAIQNQL